ncbi:poly [ADP-ribose] polymerase tankyrase [Ixodes scapularis]
MEPSTNGCKDGPTPLLVQNHSESVQQEKKTPEKHSAKTAAAAPQDISAAPATPTVTSQRTRHSPTSDGSKSQANKSAPVAAAAGNKTSTAKEEAAPVSRRTPRTGGAGSTPGPGRPQSKPPQREASRRPPPAEAPPVAPHVIVCVSFRVPGPPPPTRCMVPGACIDFGLPLLQWTLSETLWHDYEACRKNLWVLLSCMFCTGATN